MLHPRCFVFLFLNFPGRERSDTSSLSEWSPNNLLYDRVYPYQILEQHHYMIDLMLRQYRPVRTNSWLIISRRQKPFPVHFGSGKGAISKTLSMKRWRARANEKGKDKMILTTSMTNSSSEALRWYIERSINNLVGEIEVGALCRDEHLPAKTLNFKPARTAEAPCLHLSNWKYHGHIRKLWMRNTKVTIR